MSQPEAEKMKPAARRSSLLMQHAIEEGIQIPGNEYLTKGNYSSSSRQNPSAGHGQQNRGQSSRSQNSLNPTPLNSMQHRPQYQGGSSIPRAVGSAAKKSFMEPTNSSVAKAKAIGNVNVPQAGTINREIPRNPVSQSTSTGPRTNLSSVRGFVPRAIATSRPDLRAAVPQGKDRYAITRPSGIRRSTSMDSVAYLANSMLLTPSMTPGHSRKFKSPGSMNSSKRWGSVQDLTRSNTHHAKTLKVSNKKDLVSMQQLVYQFLYEMRYPDLPRAPNDLKSISTSTYYNMVSFVGKFLVGQEFFPPKSDLITRIVELASVLNYPGQLSKSNLKSANAQHAWPSSLQLLCWLCCRVQSMLNAIKESPMNDLVKATFHEVARPNYLKIHWHYKQITNTPMDEEVRIAEMRKKQDEEKEDFCRNVSEMLMCEVNFSTEELVAQMEEKQHELNDLLTKPDPIQEVTKLRDEQAKSLEVLRKKILETQERTKTYRDINGLRSKAEALKHEVNYRQSEIEAAKQIIATQPLDKRGERTMQTDILNLKEQRKCLEPILKNLETDLFRKKQSMSNLNDRFRSTISQFSVVEAFNANLSNLRVDGLSVRLNPLTPEELRVWLDEVQNIHEKTEQVSHALKQAVKGDISKLEAILTSSTKEEEQIRQNINKIKQETENLKIRDEKTSEEFEMEIKSAELKVAELNNIYKDEEKHLEHFRRKFECLEKYDEKLTTLLDRKKANLEKWNKYVEEVGVGMLLHESKVLYSSAKVKDEAWKGLQELTKHIEEVKAGIHDKRLMNPNPSKGN